MTRRHYGLAKYFYKIPKPIRIYLGVVLGVCLVIGSVYVINEMQARMNPPDQLLLQLDEEETPPPQTDFLKIYVWESVNKRQITYENYPLNDHYPIEEQDKIVALKEADSLRFSEMKTGEPVQAACERKADIWVGACPKCFETDPNYYLNWNGFRHDSYRYYDGPSGPNLFRPSVQLIAKADAIIEVSGNATAYSSKGEDDYIQNFYADNAATYEEDSRANYHIIARNTPYHQLNGPERDPNEELGSGEWDGESRYQTYYQYLDEIYPDIPSAYSQIRREVCESAVLFSAYSKTSPNVLLAQAEVKITYYSRWGKGDQRRDLSDGDIFQILVELGIDTDPDNYGYTTAEIVDYWENPEYFD